MKFEAWAIHNERNRVQELLFESIQTKAAELAVLDAKISSPFPTQCDPSHPLSVSSQRR
jgi:hypothetical protein